MRILVRVKDFSALDRFGTLLFNRLLGDKIVKQPTTANMKMILDDGSEICFISDNQDHEVYKKIPRDYEIRLCDINEPI